MSNSSDDPQKSWMALLAENYRDLGDVLDGIAERTTDEDTEEELRKVISDVREMEAHYEGDDD